MSIRSYSGSNAPLLVQAYSQVEPPDRFIGHNLQPSCQQSLGKPWVGIEQLPSAVQPIVGRPRAFLHPCLCVALLHLSDHRRSHSRHPQPMPALLRRSTHTLSGCSYTTQAFRQDRLNLHILGRHVPTAGGAGDTTVALGFSPAGCNYPRAVSIKSP